MPYYITLYVRIVLNPKLVYYCFSVPFVYVRGTYKTIQLFVMVFIVKVDC